MCLESTLKGVLFLVGELMRDFASSLIKVAQNLTALRQSLLEKLIQSSVSAAPKAGKQ